MAMQGHEYNVCPPDRQTEFMPQTTQIQVIQLRKGRSSANTTKEDGFVANASGLAMQRFLASAARQAVSGRAIARTSFAATRSLSIPRTADKTVHVTFISQTGIRDVAVHSDIRQKYQRIAQAQGLSHISHFISSSTKRKMCP
jgi:hypothetical protein